MRRVLVIGSGGAGKSTFAKRLAGATGLPLIHLDALYWRAGWVEPPKEEWAATVERLVAGEEWVMDGNYGGTLERRLEAADAVVFLDLPRTICLARVVRRRIRYIGRSRPDMTPGCPERLSWEFLRWIWEYPAKRGPKILLLLGSLRPDQRAVVLTSPAAAGAFLASLSPPRS
jgi:adenylate kinase family enzyme